MPDEQDDQQVTDDQQPDLATGSAGDDSCDVTATSEQTAEDQSASQTPKSDDQGSMDVGDTSGQTSEEQGTRELSESDKQSLQDLMADPIDSQADILTPAKSKTGDCSGWESDPRGFAKAVADNYISTEFNRMPANVAKNGISCWPSKAGGTVSDFCYLHYEDGWNVIVNLVKAPDYVQARAIKPEMKQRCTYDYDCTASGTLSFTRRRCEN